MGPPGGDDSSAEARAVSRLWNVVVVVNRCNLMSRFSEWDRRFRGMTGLISLAFLLYAKIVSAQTAPVSPDRPWHGELQIEADARRIREFRFSIDPTKTYTLPELIDLAESHNPETRVAWERARAQAAAWGVARSELYPTVAAAALAGANRTHAYLEDRFFRQTFGDFEVALNLDYTIFDFGARAGRINAAQA